MSPDWSPLRRELAHWREEGRSYALWWRDDDTIGPTDALDRLQVLSARLGLPVHLAIIPGAMSGELPTTLSQTAIPVVHGWRHHNHAPPDQKKAEFGTNRPLDQRIADAQAGFARLSAAFNGRIAPIFVPPWNRIGADLFVPLSAAGYRAVSTYLPRASPEAAPGLSQINTHIDPIDWRGSRDLVDPNTLITQTAQVLIDRRTGRTDNGEPLGLLTHHLVHTPAIWHFTESWIMELLDGPARIWTHTEKDTA